MRRLACFGILSFVLNGCVPFDLWSSQPSCQTASSDPQVMTLSWKPDWEIGHVDINQSGEFFFSPRSDNKSQSEHLRWDTLIRVMSNGSQTKIRTGPEVQKAIGVMDLRPGYNTTPTGDPGFIAVWGSRIWVSDWRNGGQIRVLDPVGWWFHEETWFDRLQSGATNFSNGPMFVSPQGKVLSINTAQEIYHVKGPNNFSLFRSIERKGGSSNFNIYVLGIDGQENFYTLPWLALEEERINPDGPPIPSNTKYFNLNNFVYKITLAGMERWVGTTEQGFKDGVAEQARFKEPSHLAAARDGTVYVSDTGNHAIRKISPTGEVTTLIGNGAPGSEDGPLEQARLDTPRHILLGPCHRLYVFDKNGVREIALPPGPSAERWGPPVTSEAKAES